MTSAGSCCVRRGVVASVDEFTPFDQGVPKMFNFSPHCLQIKKKNIYNVTLLFYKALRTMCRVFVNGS